MEARHPGCVPKSEQQSWKAAEKGCLWGQTLPAQQGPVAGLVLACPRAQRGLKATVGATVRGAAGRGQSSLQTVTFSGRLSCNTFSGRRKEVEAFVLKRPPRTKPRRASRVDAGPAQGAAGLISPGESRRRWSLSASLPTLPAVFVCVSSSERTDARLGRAPGRNEPSSPSISKLKGN